MTSCQAPQPTPHSILNLRHFALLLGILLAICFPTVLVGVDTFFFRDFAFFGYPLAAYHRASFWAGEIPLWNPFNNAGIPFLAQWNTMTLYPGALLYLLFPLPWSLNVFCLAHFYLAGLGMYQLARHWTGSNIPAAIAGTAFAFSGLVLSCLKWPNNIAALGWMPLVVLAVEQAWTHPRRKFLSAVLFGAMQMLTGAPEIILFTWAILALLWIADCIRSCKLSVAFTFPLVVLAVSLLSAAQLLPFLDLLAHSQRDRHFGGAMWPMPLTGLANFFLPLFNTFVSYHGVSAQPGQYWISTYYLSLPVLALALAALFLARHLKVWLLAASALLALVLSLGTQAFLYEWFRASFPFLSFMRFPIKFITLAIFILPLLAAFGATALLATPRNRLVTILFALLAAAPLFLAFISSLSPEQFHHSPALWKNAFFRSAFLVVFLSAAARFVQTQDPPRRAFLATALCVVLWADAITHSPWQNPTAPSWVYLGKGADLRPVPQIGESRAMITGDAYDKLDHLIFDTPENDVLGSRLSLYANANLLEGIPKIDGFFALYLQQMHKLDRLIYTRGINAPALLDFLAISHLTAPGKTRTWETRPSSLPWVTAGQVPRILPDPLALNHLASPQFDPKSEVILPEATSLPPVKGKNVQLHSVRISPHDWFLEVEADGDGIVVCSQAFHPLWKATIDQQPLQILRANVGCQAILVPNGRHVIHLRYLPAYFRLGAFISISTLLALLLLGSSRFSRPPV